MNQGISNMAIAPRLVVFSEFDVDRILSDAMIEIACSAHGSGCSKEKLLKALTESMNKAIRNRACPHLQDGYAAGAPNK
jgi:hypothetical protein